MRKEKSIKIFLVILGLTAGLLLAEGLLRLTTVGMTYTEEREGIFVNPADRMEKSWYKTAAPYSELELKAPEYDYMRKTNNEGCSDKEWSTAKDSNEIRILALGDSFTQGDGAPYDSSYPYLLQQLLQKEFDTLKINVMNAGLGGSDPWFEYKKLTDLFLKYKPDIVVYTNGSNDLFFDHLNYGGMERFRPDSTVTNRIPQPRTMGLYKASYLFRMIMFFTCYDETFFTPADHAANEITSVADSKELSKMYSALAVQNNFDVVQLLRPEREEVEEGAYLFNKQELLEGTHSLPRYTTFDLLAYYRDSLHITGANTGDYFWQMDGHHNPRGYAAMAQAAFAAVAPVIKAR